MDGSSAHEENIWTSPHRSTRLHQQDSCRRQRWIAHAYERASMWCCGDLVHPDFRFVPPQRPRSDVMATIRFFFGQPDVSIPSSVTCGGSFSSEVHACKAKTSRAYSRSSNRPCGVRGCLQYIHTAQVVDAVFTDGRCSPCVQSVI